MNFILQFLSNILFPLYLIFIFRFNASSWKSLLETVLFLQKLFYFHFRWFENLKLILSGVTRPTRRGPIFKNLRPRKIPLSRHYRTIHLSLALHRFHIHYWMSFAMQRGLELTGQRISSSSGQTAIVYFGDVSFSSVNLKLFGHPWAFNILLNNLPAFI